MVPPKQLQTPPVLPLKIGGKLVFPLCRKCADEAEKGKQSRLPYAYSKDSAENLEMCLHNDRERGFVSTYVFINYLKR